MQNHNDLETHTQELLMESLNSYAKIQVVKMFKNKAIYLKNGELVSSNLKVDGFHINKTRNKLCLNFFKRVMYSSSLHQEQILYSDIEIIICELVENWSEAKYEIKLNNNWKKELNILLFSQEFEKLKSVFSKIESEIEECLNKISLVSLV